MYVWSGELEHFFNMRSYLPKHTTKAKSKTIENKNKFNNEKSKKMTIDHTKRLTIDRISHTGSL